MEEGRVPTYEICNDMQPNCSRTVCSNGYIFKWLDPILSLTVKKSWWQSWSSKHGPTFIELAAITIMCRTYPLTLSGI